MLMVYNSEAFAVVEIEIDALDAPASSASASSTSASSSTPSTSTAPSAAADGGAPTGGRSAFEIVDKMAHTDLLLTGDLARHFREGVEALSAQDSSSDDIDAFIARFSGLPQQPLILH